MKAKLKSGFIKFALFLNRYRFLWIRIGIAILTLFFAVLLTFFILKLTPNNAIDEYAIYLMETRRISLAEARIMAVQILGYDPAENTFIQLFRYIGNLFQGNLGTSIRTPGVTANQVIAEFLPYTLFISAIALVISFFIGIFMGTDMAYKRSKTKDIASTSFIVVSSSVPDYLWGIIFLFVFACMLGWFPRGEARDVTNGLPAFIDLLWHATLPILALVVVQVASWALLMRGSCVSVLGEDYIYAAKARGIPSKVIQRKYLRRNALLPLITTIAMSFAALFAGSTLIESVFNYPGIGLQLAAYIGARDYYVIVGILFFTSFVVIFANLIADSIYSFIDPRIRRSA